MVPKHLPCWSRVGFAGSVAFRVVCRSGASLISAKRWSLARMAKGAARWFAWGRNMSLEEAAELAELLDGVFVVRVSCRRHDGRKVESFSVTVRDSDALELLSVVKGNPHPYRGV